MSGGARMMVLRAFARSGLRGVRRSDAGVDPQTGLHLLAGTGQQAPYGFDFAANVMHADTDGICPRCLTWLEPDDIVRRTGFGPLQHETCPVTNAERLTVDG